MCFQPEGGYQLKCSNILEITWILENNWSHIASFHHRMKFDLDYINESYIKTVAQAHKQLSNPKLDMDERTLLLAKIISTCLEAQGLKHSVQESTESESETVRIEKRRKSLDKEPEMPVPKKKKEDSEVMAPPKALPKKPKGKENVAENHKTSKTGKRVNHEIGDNIEGKKAKNNIPEKVLEPKNIVSHKRTANETENTKVNNDIKEMELKNKKSNNLTKDRELKETGNENVKNPNKMERENNNIAKRSQKEIESKRPANTQNQNKEKEGKPKNFNEGNKKPEKGKKLISVECIIPNKDDTNREKSGNTVKSTKLADKLNMKTVKENVHTSPKMFNKTKSLKETVVEKPKNIENQPINGGKEATTKHHTLSGNTVNAKGLKTHQNKPKASITKSMNSRFIKAPKFDKRNPNLQTSSKIPQTTKKSSSAENILKKNPLRISPRNNLTKFNTMSSLNSSIWSSRSSTRIVNTNIPRLVKKPISKTKS
ncbi:unnamed protein product [Parnassius apollo]|uniref:(apollo) hypothetical protein n=1 Tax=Parnassius apollo TaxID=110799 RepID=A0A8S3Y939_PARAO|nr:unnamed protein product [Parnassius apollo]